LTEFEGISSTEDLITLNGGIDNLGNDSSVGGSCNKSVLGGVVFILVLDDESLSGVVVSDSLSSSSVLGLEALEVSLGLLQFNETHLR